MLCAYLFSLFLIMLLALKMYKLLFNITLIEGISSCKKKLEISSPHTYKRSIENDKKEQTIGHRACQPPSSHSDFKKCQQNILKKNRKLNHLRTEASYDCSPPTPTRH